MGLFRKRQPPEPYHRFKALGLKASIDIIDIMTNYADQNDVDDYGFVQAWYMDFMEKLTQLKPSYFEGAVNVMATALETKFPQFSFSRSKEIGPKIAEYTIRVQLFIDRRWSIDRYNAAIRDYFGERASSIPEDYFVKIITGFLRIIDQEDIDPVIWNLYYSKYRREPARENISDYYWWNIKEPF